MIALIYFLGGCVAAGGVMMIIYALFIFKEAYDFWDADIEDLGLILAGLIMIVMGVIMVAFGIGLIMC